MSLQDEPEIMAQRLSLRDLTVDSAPAVPRPPVLAQSEAIEPQQSDDFDSTAIRWARQRSLERSNPTT